MRLGILVIGAVLSLTAAGPTWAAAVNCKQVNKYLQTGRSVKDIAETMVIDESDVKKCQEQAGSEGAGGGGKAGGGSDAKGQGTETK
jgi:hypothetical protein